MKRFAVNLLTLFQCPALWLGHVLCSFVFLVLVLNPPKDPVAEDRRFVGYLLIIYWIGIVVSSMAKEIMTKPFAFGLPRQGATLRAFILVTGLMVSIVMAGLIMDLPGSTGAETAAAFCSAAALGMILYLLGLATIFLFRSAASFWILPVLAVWIVDGANLQAFLFVKNLTFHQPLWNTFLAGILILITWYKLGSRTLSRDLCGKAFLPLQSMWNKSKIDSYNSRKRLDRMNKPPLPVTRGVERFLFDGMIRQPFLTGRKFFMGIRYTIFHNIRPVTMLGPIALIGLFAGLVMILGFTGPSERFGGLSSADILFLAPCMLVTTVPLPLFSTLLLPAGRKDKFWCCIHIGWIAALAALVINLVLFLFSETLFLLIPEIIFFGEARVFLPMEPNLIFAPLPIIPVFYLIQLVFPRRTHIPQLVFMIIVVMIYINNIEALLHMGMVVFGVLLALSWGLFVFTSRYRCMSTDLVIQ